MNVDEIRKLMEGIGKNPSIQLLVPLSDKAGFFCTEGRLVYMSLDTFDYSVESIDTDFLSLQIHVPIHAVDNSPTFHDGFYNIIVYKGEIGDDNSESFVNLCSLHAVQDKDLAFREFFYALISLFQLPREQTLKNAIGLYGELKYMQHVAEDFDIDISPFWHKRGPMSKFDFSNNNIGLEVKTTTADKSTTKIKHDQIFGDYACYLVTVECDESEIGESILDVISSMKNTASKFNNLNFVINIERELKRVSSQQLKEMLFSVNSIRTFKASDINPFISLPDNVFDLSYDLDLSEKDAFVENDERLLIAEFVHQGEML